MNPTSIEETVRRHWATVLEIPVDSVTADSDFFAQGGDSLLAAELVAAISDDIQTDVDIAQLFLDASFSELVNAALEARALAVAAH